LHRPAEPERGTLRLFVTYVAIGGTTFVFYISLFTLLERAGVLLPVAATVAYFCGTALHFSLNRWANFRRFDRAVHDQARTFGAVIFLQWLVTLTVVTLLTAHGVVPTLAAVVAVVVNLPGGFIANRYLTFGIGIVPRVLRLLKVPK
jgi:putative flippase GtrA